MKLQICITLSILLVGIVPLQASSPRNAAERIFDAENLSSAYRSSDLEIEIFNREKGGFIVATDEKVIGYSDSGCFNDKNIPEALKELIENYRKNSSAYSFSEDTHFSAVSPLLGKMVWDQTEPYNMMCPLYLSSFRSATGCAATAMAQVMRYHQYPLSGRGSHSYQPEFYPGMGTLSVDFSQSEYDWGNMLEDYRMGYDEMQQNAVARLMYDAGVAISMNYGPQSGAMSQDWPNALVEYFSYDPGVAIRYRVNYEIKDWLEIIHYELDEGRPVFATGFTPEGGHAFVFDGMDESGMIHVNWGWSGMSNGYFDATFLSPSTQGTGGSSGGFNSRQFIVTGIQPPLGDSEPFVGLASEEGLTTVSKTPLDASISLKINGKISNVGWQNSIVDFGLSLMDCDGNMVRNYSGPEEIAVAIGTPYRNLKFENVTLGDIPEGNYRLVPMAKHSGGKKWERIRDVDTSYPNYLNVVVEGDNATITAPQLANILGSDMKADSNIVSGVKTKINLVVANEGESEYYGALTPVLIDPATGKRVATSSSSSLIIDLMPSSKCEVDLYPCFSVEPGEYLISVIDYNYANIIKPQSVSVSPACEMSIMAVSAPVFNDGDDVDPLDVKAETEVGCSEGMYSGQLFLYIYSLDGTAIVGCLGPEFVNMSEGSTVKVTFSGSFENGIPGEEYEARVINGEEYTYIFPRELSTSTFKVGEPSMVENINSYEAGPKRYFTIQGMELPEPPARGMYLESDGLNVRKILK